MNVIKVSDYGSIEMSSIRDVFHPYQSYYSVKYIENGAEHISIKFDMRTLTSLLTTLFAIQSYIQGDENYENVITIYPEMVDTINVYRYKGFNHIDISLNNIIGFKINNNYVESVFSSLETIFLESIPKTNNNL